MYIDEIIYMRDRQSTLYIWDTYEVFVIYQMHCQPSDRDFTGSDDSSIWKINSFALRPKYSREMVY